MLDFKLPTVAVIDYRMGNVFSIKNACNKVGLNAEITSSREDIMHADAVILPGVGAFGDAMKMLRELKLIEIVKDAALSKPFVGVCLGMQLLMSGSYEFGYHVGLEILEGDVIRFENPVDDSGRNLKVPHIGWNHVNQVKDGSADNKWENSLLKELEEGGLMYFVHSYYVKPDDSSLVLSETKYGNINFCSSLCYRNIFACQFHPERSGEEGLKIYEALFSTIGNGGINNG